MSKPRTHCFALDLKDDPASIEEYEAHHQQVWPEIVKSIKARGILSMEIFRTGNRLFMILRVNDSFSFDKKAEAYLQNKKVQEWEELMWRYQQALPFAEAGEKWVLMKKIFELNDSTKS